MTGKNSAETPFKTLGTHLRRIRQRLKESVAEVSGAVEIEEMTLRRIEQGTERPSEDILLLLITHFGMQDDEAVRLWELAGYDKPQFKDEDETQTNRPLLMVMAVDSRISYSDKVEIVAGPNGVVMNFMQAPDGPYPPQTISRIGMSREQAAKVVKILHQTIVQSEQIMQKQKDRSARDSEENKKSDRS